MTVPVTTVRLAPAGQKLRDGHPTMVTFAADPDAPVWEKVTKPPGYDNGDAIDQTTFHNKLWRTKASRSLVEVTDVTSTVAYDPRVYRDSNGFLSMIGQEQSITVTFKNGDTLAFFGYLKSFEPNDHTDGEQPEAVMTIVITNWDPVNCVEEGPHYIEATGTHC